MKTPFVSILILAALAGGILVAEEALKFVPQKPHNGVFLSYTGYMTTILELEDGRFRYWFDSDSKRLDEPKYPIEGNYSVEGNRIILDHESVSQKEWTCRKFGDLLTLWRPDALKIEADGTSFEEYYPLGMRNFRRCGAGAILVSTKRSAEEAWAKPVYAELTEGLPKDLKKGKGNPKKEAESK